MVNVLRRWSQTLMVVIATLVIVSFAWFMGPTSSLDHRGGRVEFTAYDKPVTTEQFQRQLNKMKVHAQMGSEFARAMRVQGSSMIEDEHDDPVANSIVFAHEADLMGVSASDDEVNAELEKTPAFMGPTPDGKFGFIPASYDIFVKNALQPNGFSADDLSAFLADSVRVRKVKELLRNSAPVMPAEVRDQALKNNIVTEASYVEFKRDDVLPQVTATDEEIAKRYEEQKEQYKTEELRKVRVAVFEVPPVAPEKVLTDVEKTKALQLCVNAAYDLAQTVRKGKTFDELVAQQKTVEKPPYVFSLIETEPFGKESVPETLEGKNADVSEKVSEAVFALTKEAPVSAHIIGKKAAYVAMLADGGVIAPKQKPLEEVKSVIAGKIKNEKAAELVKKNATDIQKKIADAKKAGKSFSEACEANGVKAVAFPAFSRMKPANDPLFGSISATTAKLAPGDVSDIVSTDNGVIIVHVDQRPVVDEKTISEQMLGLTNNIQTRREMYVFQEWLKERRRKAIPVSVKVEEQSVEKKG